MGCQEEFSRRIDRFYGRRKEVPPSKPRVFVRAANSTQELGASVKLLQALRESLPKTKVFLLVIIDLQKSPGPVLVNHPSCEGLIYKVGENQFTGPSSNLEGDDCVKKFAVAYAGALAHAIRIWAGEEAAMSSVKYETHVHRLEASCQPFEGGDPSDTIYQPHPKHLPRYTPILEQSLGPPSYNDEDEKDDEETSRLGFLSAWNWTWKW